MGEKRRKGVDILVGIHVQKHRHEERERDSSSYMKKAVGNMRDHEIWVVIMALKKLHLISQPPSNRGSWNINVKQGTGISSRESSEGDKSGAFNAHAFMALWG